MVEYAPPVLQARREQMYLVLIAAEIDRLRRFGAVRGFADARP